MTSYHIVRLTLFLGLMACVSPVQAIVVVPGGPNGVVSFGGTSVDGVTINLAGVVELTDSIGGCSGSLLTDGDSILTAAHCVTSSYGSPIATNMEVTFPGSITTYSVSNVQVDPGYTGSSAAGTDLAVLTLSQAAPAGAVEYPLFTGNYIPSGALVMAGYGYGGNGDTGADTGFGVLRAGLNQYAGYGSTYFNGLSSSQLIGEFYDSTTSSTNGLFESNPNASGNNEVDISPGDSGGPTFYNGEIAGVHDLIFCASSSSNGPCTQPPSENASNDSYFGQDFADTSVSANLAFIQSAETPEPGTSALLLCGLASLAWFRARKTGV